MSLLVRNCICEVYRYEFSCDQARLAIQLISSSPQAHLISSTYFFQHVVFHARNPAFSNLLMSVLPGNIFRLSWWSITEGFLAKTYEALASDRLQVDIMLNMLHIRGFVSEDIFYRCWRVSPGTVGVVGHEETGNRWISLGVETRPEGLVAWFAQILRT